MKLKKIIYLALIIFVTSGCFRSPSSQGTNNALNQISDAVRQTSTKVTDLASRVDKLEGSTNPSSVSNQPENITDLVEVSWDKELKLLPNDCGNSCSYENYHAGKILNGIYKDRDLYVEAEQGMGTSYRHYTLVGDVKAYFDTISLGIKGIHNLPATIQFPLKKEYTLKKGWVANSFFKDIEVAGKIFTDPIVGDFYLTKQGGCLIAELPDHTAIAYDFIISFINTETGILDIGFFGGAKNAEGYTYTQIMGCGAMCMYLAVKNEAELKPSSRLEEAGFTNPGQETIYAIADQNDAALKALYEDKNTAAYFSADWKTSPTNKYTYGQFIEHRPLLYWKDPLGRWVEFKNNLFTVIAEMCKPVIYVYPEQTTKMKITVHPNGGMTYSTPQYTGAWDIEATPKGMITDVRDNKKYEYLFWEGIGMNYPTEERGWIVERSRLLPFFKEKLSYLGLSGRELKDFTDYWIQRLSEKPYYKISFLKKEQFDKLAPLEITTKPTTVIRIMMTAQGRDRYEYIEPQVLEKPVSRSGFTVIEWGGVVLK